MLFRELQSLKAQGHLKGAALSGSDNKNGWMIEFETDDGESVYLTRKDGAPYACKSVDSATRVAKHIGFRSLSVPDGFKN